MELRGAVAIVTGGTGGLGATICRALAGEGMRVAVCYRERREAAETLAAELGRSGGEGAIFQLDAGDPRSIDALVDRVAERFGRIDALVNNAAYNKWIAYRDLPALGLDDWTRILTINLTAPFLLIRAVAPVMQRQGRGRIVNVGSVAGLAPTGSSIAYAVSKAGLVQLTRCTAVALAPDILVNCVAPGYMEGTRMTENLDPSYRQRATQSALLGRAAEREDVARQVVEFCRTDSTTGQTLVIDAGRIFH